jgi:RND family efflux transporter MFP subunit
MSSNSNSRVLIWSAGLVVSAIILVSSGCSGSSSAARAPQIQPPDVDVARVEQKDVPIFREWIGKLDGMINAEINATVTGYLLTQNYTEGSYVKKGQLLFEIDPRPYEAALDQSQRQLSQASGRLAPARAQLVQAQAQLVLAQANQRHTQFDVDSYVSLAKQAEVTQQDFDNATQNNLAAQAQVAAANAWVETARAQIQVVDAVIEVAKASVEAARLNFGFTRLTSPIGGIAGHAEVQLGTLVGPADGPITTVSTLEPIKTEFTVREQEYLAITRCVNGLDRLQLNLILADGTTYAYKGKLLFADRQVDQNTGAILLIGQFPNPGNMLRPGQRAKIRAIEGTQRDALLVPQRAVMESHGNYQVAVVSNDNKVAIENIKVGDRVAQLWIINDGLKAGQRVIVDGMSKIRSCFQVNPKPVGRSGAR